MPQPLLRRAGDQISQIIEAGAVAGAVPAALVRVPLHLTAHMRAAQIDGKGFSLFVFVDAQLFAIQKHNAAVTGRQFSCLLRGDLKKSSHEGLPIALLEAMSYQLPVITSSIPANLEVGLNTECYHEVGDVDALATKLSAIISQPLQRIGYDMSKYDWDRIAVQVSDIYNSLK